MILTVGPIGLAGVCMGSSQISWQGVFEALPHPAFVLDKDHRIIALNKAALSRIGLPAQQVIGKACHQVCHGTDHPPKGCPLETLNANGNTPVVQMEVQAFNGTYLVSCMPIGRLEDDRAIMLHIAADITPLRQTQQQLELQRAKLQGIYLAVPVGIGLVQDRILKEHNQRLCEMIGYTREEILGRDSRFLYLSEQEYDRVGRNYQNVRQFGMGTIESQWRCKDGRVIDVLLNYAALNPKDISEGVIFTALDITKRKEYEQEIRLLNRLYATLSNINQAIVRIKDIQALFEATCRIAVEQGQFRLAWIGLVDQQTRQVRPAAWAGHEDGYLRLILVTATDQPEGRGPVGTAIREGRLCVCQDVEKDQMMLPWRAPALERGYRAVAAVPIRSSGQIIGALAIYAAEPGFFTEHEQRLLMEMGQDLSFAIDAAEGERQRRQIEAALEASEQRLQLATIGANDGLWDWPDLTQDGQWWSPVFYKLLGYEQGQIEPSYTTFCGLVHPKDLTTFRAAVADQMKKAKPLDVQCRIRTRSGRYRWFRIKGGVVGDSEGRPTRMAGSILDITDLYRAYARLAANQRRISSLATQLSIVEEQQRRRIAVGVHDDIGQRLALAKLQLQGLLQALPEKDVRVLEDVCELIDQAMQHARSLAFELSNPVLYEVGLEAAVEAWPLCA
jgi:PAS domain S-box-containing protein